MIIAFIQQLHIYIYICVCVCVYISSIYVDISLLLFLYFIGQVYSNIFIMIVFIYIYIHDYVIGICCYNLSNHQPHDWLLYCLFRRRSKKTSNLHVTGLCAGNSPVSGEFPAQKARDAEFFFIWWRHHGVYCSWKCSTNSLLMLCYNL